MDKNDKALEVLDTFKGLRKTDIRRMHIEINPNTGEERIEINLNDGRTLIQESLSYGTTMKSEIKIPEYNGMAERNKIILELHDKKIKQKQIARVVGVSQATVSGVIRNNK